MLKRIDLQSGGRLKLKIEGKGKYYSFYYSIDSENWILLAEDIDASLLSTKFAGGFVGTYIGMYASSNH